MAMRHPDGMPYEEYRQARRHCLGEYLQAVKVRYPEAKDIVGIGTGPPEDEDSAEDLLYLDAREWTEEHQREAERLQQETGFLTRIIRHEGRVKSYPDVAPRPDVQSGKGPKGRDRNKLCHCGSNKKFKRCCGR
jgi:hypothetical protein